MYVPKAKIAALIEFYGKQKNYPTKSHLKKFAEDNNLNYNQWQAYSTGTANAGIKILGALIEIFPTLNLNWLFKDDPKMFTSDSTSDEIKLDVVREVDLNTIYKKLTEVHSDIKEIAVKL